MPMIAREFFDEIAVDWLSALVSNGPSAKARYN